MYDYDKLPKEATGFKSAMKSIYEDGTSYHQHGHFVGAIFENDLTQAFNRADDTNVKYIGDFVAWLYWEVPTTSWGKNYREDWREN